jgi:hypothetical protein
MNGDNYLGQELQNPVPVPTVEKRYAGLDDWLNPQLRMTRYDEREFPIIGWLVARSLSDKELTGVQSSIYKGSTGQIDTVKSQQSAARLIIEVIVNKDSKKPYLTESHIKHIREIDAGLIDAIAAWCRSHVGLLDEEAAKNEPATP